MLRLRARLALSLLLPSLVCCGSSGGSGSETHPDAAAGASGTTAQAGSSASGGAGGAAAAAGGATAATGGATAAAGGGATVGAGGAAGTPASGGASAAGSGGVDSGDGPLTRNACTGNFGSALSLSFGRLDGYLVSIVMPTMHVCNGDDHHVHLQVSANGAVYDVAVDILSSKSTGAAAEVAFAQLDAPLAGMPWAEGWHPGAPLDYVGSLKEHASSFTSIPEPMLATTVEQQLATANHISIFGTGYGPTGMHKIHRNYTNEDGAVVVSPTLPSAHYLLFHFSTQTFLSAPPRSQAARLAARRGPW